MMTEDDFEILNFGGNDDIWLMAYQTSSDRQVKTTISPESLRDEEVREKVADAVVTMIEKIILEQEESDD